MFIASSNAGANAVSYNFDQSVGRYTSEAWLRELVNGMPQMIWRAIGLGTWTWSSPQWERYTGQDATTSSGLGWLDVIHPDDRETARKHWEQAPAAGEYDIEVRMASSVDFQTRGRPVRDETHSITEWIGTSTDVNDMRQLQSEQKVLVAELQHRTRNLIAVDHSICMQTLQRANTLQGFGDRFEERLSALSRVQGLLSTSDQDPITIRRLLELELHAVAAGQIATQVHITGPHVILKKLDGADHGSCCARAFDKCSKTRSARVA